MVDQCDSPFLTTTDCATPDTPSEYELEEARKLIEAFQIFGNGKQAEDLSVTDLRAISKAYHKNHTDRPEQTELEEKTGGSDRSEDRVHKGPWKKEGRRVRKKLSAGDAGKNKLQPYGSDESDDDNLFTSDLNAMPCSTMAGCLKM